MPTFLRRLRGAAAVGLTWAVGWAVVGGLLATVIRIFRPQDFDPGENAVVIVGLFGVTGFVAGVAFALLVSLAERRGTVGDVSVTRSALWGALGAAALPLLTTMNDEMAILMAPLGAAFAAGTISVAKRSAHRDEVVQ